MDEKIPNSSIKLSWFSKIFFTWLYPILWRGWKNPTSISEDDIDIPLENCTKTLVELLQQSWNSQIQQSKNKKTKQSPSFFKALAKVFGTRYMLLGFTAFVEECVIRVIQPLLVGLLLQSLRNDSSKRETWLFASGVVLLSVWYAVQHHPFFFALQTNGMKIRIATSGLIYQKALELNSVKSAQISPGRILNLLSNDVNRLDLSKDFMHYIWIAPIQFIIVTAILFYYFKWISFVAMTLLVVFIPLQSFMGRKFGVYRGLISRQCDLRLRRVNEVIKNISSIKTYAWEEPFSQKVDSSREDEIKLLGKTARLRSLNQSLYYVSCKLLLFALLLVYVLVDNELTPEKVFLASALLNNVRMTMTLFFPFGISQFAEIRVTLKRIEEFLLMAQSDDEAITSSNCDKDSIVSLENVIAKWKSENEAVVINASFKATKGDFVGVVGPVASGKSSLLQIIIGELPLLSGELKVNGKIGYTSQDPHIFIGTIRDNITFGRAFDQSKYSKIVDTCSLLKDFKQMPFGDRTYLTSGGVLSGGQRARISLARALYSEPDILILDDILSAVDVKTAQHLYTHAISSGIENRITIFATHQYKFLMNSTAIVEFTGNGNIHVWKTFAEFQRNRKSDSNDNAVEVTESLDVDIDHFDDEEDGAELIEKLQGSKHSESLLITQVPLKLYWTYFRNGGSILLLLVLFLTNIGAQILFTGSDYWLKFWTANMVNTSKDSLNSNNSSSNSFLDKLKYDKDVQIGVYTGIMGALLVFSFLRTSLFFSVCLRASKKMHKTLFSSVLGTRLRFFQNNPIGQIMNRFSKDFAALDDTLPLVLFDTVEVALQVIGVLIVTSTVNYYLVLPALFVCFCFYFIRKLYLKTAQIIKRQEGIARSPILSHMNATLSGLPTIRALQGESFATSEFHSYLDSHSRCWFIFLASSRWLGVTVDWVSIVYISCVVIVMMTTGVTDAEAGLAITSAMSLMGIMQWGVKQSSEAASQMISVERILEYSTLESEEIANDSFNSILPIGSSEWPTEGSIEFTNMSYRYSPESPDVLKDISFKISGGEHIGIVGRTGAGKTSLIQAFLRFEEPQGMIIIDGVDHKLLHLKLLRSKITTLPQSPFIFNGTLRENLDPCGIYNDDELFNALDSVNLRPRLVLDTQLDEDGNNLSGGQKQLICLCRALLRRSKILIMDEATANIDFETDGLIQETIQNKLTFCTLLVIAHRIQTVINSDKILVLDGGLLKEFNEPRKLLDDPSSALSQLTKISQSN